LLYQVDVLTDVMFVMMLVVACRSVRLWSIRIYLFI